MANLNKIMDTIKKSTSDTESMVKDLLLKYEDLYRESNIRFNEERVANAGSMNGLEEFYRVVQTIRRNRDVVGSFVRGLQNLRSMDGFKFVEENLPEKPEKKKKQIKKTEPKLNEQEVQGIQMPTEIKQPDETPEVTHA